MPSSDGDYSIGENHAGDWRDGCAGIPEPESGESWWWAGTKGFFKGLGQGILNTANGVQDIVVGVVNLTGGVAYNGTSWVVNRFGGDNPYGWIPSPDWSRGLLTDESGEPGTWGDTHGWSKFAGGSGATALAGVLNAAATSKYSPQTVELGNAIKNWLGEGSRAIPTTKGDTVFISKDGLRRFRTDFNNMRGEVPHIHFQEKVNGKWIDFFPNLPHRIPVIP